MTRLLVAKLEYKAFHSPNAFLVDELLIQLLGLYVVLTNHTEELPGVGKEAAVSEQGKQTVIQQMR